MNLNDFSKWLQYNRVNNLRGSEYFPYPLYILNLQCFYTFDYFIQFIYCFFVLLYFLNVIIVFKSMTVYSFFFF